MDLLQEYGDSSDEETTTTTTTKQVEENNNNNNNNNNVTKEFKSFKPSLSIAPSVKNIQVLENKVDPNSKILSYNPTVESLYGETEGPETPFTRSKQRIDPSLKNHKTGIVENYYINDFSFKDQYYTYKSYGYAADPNTGVIVGDKDSYINHHGASVYNNIKQQENNNNNSNKKKKRDNDDPSDVKGYMGPWAPKQHEIDLRNKLQQQDEEDAATVGVEMSVEQKAYLDMRKKQSIRDKEASQVTSVFYGKERKDYMGRSWIEPPSDLKTGVEVDSFLPKKLIHTWTGHNKGVSAIRFFPRYGHLLLSASMDSSVRIWDYDARSGDIVQDYDQHLGAINTITFIDDNRRFVSSSDDKSLRIWDWGIPVVIKYVSEPEMHSMPAVALHPSGKYFATQSMDNQILVYGARDKFRMNKKKRFTGHTNAGYACQLNFSPDGKYVISGDATGKAYFWDWKTSKVIKSFKAHDDVCIGIEWHPLETSRVATCGWDGTIKYFD
ncbi:WD40 repeat-containing protein [Cavenderia fasciculata]|uniref:WD40 repeat-containing protein n=1 Tax=Cavenderia fasciculata TaxID=261658 RepID=F4PGU0_CACFS|nr:WD40 repeat-containing protein [Cavenderia fasciculata]EGG24924.1 WD40 repeat-containing protein [Cavenderia fasciculata]|eukprot:XP_004362775.1 WD40 repeat-containing protein [Cavenderia fasciculata]